MVGLLLGEPCQLAHQVGHARVVGDQLHRRGGRLLLAVRVIAEGGIEVGEGHLDPARIGARAEDAHRADATSSLDARGLPRNPVEPESGDEVGRHDPRSRRCESRGRREHPHHGRRVGTPLPELPHRERPVALGEPLAVGSHHQRDVGEARRGEAQRPVQQELAGGRGEQVVAAEHVGHLHGGVVHHHGELVGRDPIGPGDHEVPHRGGDVEQALPMKCVPERDRPLRNPDPPGGRAPGGAGCPLVRGESAAGPRIARPLVGGVRRLGGLGDLGAGAEARVGEPRRAEAVERRRVASAPLRLPVRTVRTAHVGPLVPVDPEPAQLLEDAGLEPRTHPRAVQVLDPHRQDAPPGSHVQPGEQRGPGVPQVKGPGGTGGESSADGGGVRQHILDNPPPPRLQDGIPDA